MEVFYDKKGLIDYLVIYSDEDL